MKRGFTYLIISIMLSVMMLGNTSFAASGSVQLSGGSANVGSTVTVKGTVKCSSGKMGAASVVMTFDPSALQYVSGSSGTNGGSGSVQYAGYGDGSVTSLSFSVKFKVLKEGSHKVSVSSADGYNFDEQQLTMSKGSATVKGVVPEPEKPSQGSDDTQKPEQNGNSGTQKPDKDQNTETKSSNSKLQALKVYPGTLSPAFSAGTGRYTVKVGQDVTDVTISATAQDSKARISVSGGKNLSEGSNTARVVVTAEDGSSRSYVITIIRGEEPENKEPEKEAVTINLDGAMYTLNENISQEELPTGFEVSKVTYQGTEYQGASHTKGELELLYLTDAEGKQRFVICKDSKLYPFLQVQISEIRYIVLLPWEMGTKEATSELTYLELQEKQFSALKEENQETYVFYVMTNEGLFGYYRYDKVDDTFQRIIVSQEADVVETPQNKTEGFLEQYRHEINFALLILEGLVMVLLIVILTIRIAKFMGKRNQQEEHKKEKKREPAKQKEKKQHHARRDQLRKRNERKKKRQKRIEEKRS